MHLIVDSSNRIVDICKYPFYVRRQKNGIVVRCGEELADAIYSDNTDTFWPIENVGYLCESHTAVEVETVPEEVVVGYYFYQAGEFYPTESDLAALEKSKKLEVQTAALEQQVTDLQMALCDMYEAMEVMMS